MMMMMEYNTKGGIFTLLQLLCLSWLLLAAASKGGSGSSENDVILDPSFLQKFVDPLPDMPRIYSYTFKDGVPVSKPLKIGMFQKLWKFHRDLPETRVFAYGTSKRSATVPGPTIESLQGTPTVVTWRNQLRRNHILPWDATIPSALPTLKHTGVPTVVHLHGGINPPGSDGHALAWFTYRFKETGPTWSNKTYRYPNDQQPGNLWYHDHAMGLTRVNLLAGLFGAYVIRNPSLESPLGLPSGTELDRHLLLADRSFRLDGSIYMNRTGNNPNIHPQWQPEYFGQAIVVNGIIWPFLKVSPRWYRFRIINTSNARFFRLFLTGALPFIHIGSDSSYLPHPVATTKFLLAPSETADVLVDFSKANSRHILLHNDAPYPYPGGDKADNRTSGVVMKFVITRLPEEEEDKRDESVVPSSLILHPKAHGSDVATTRYVVMYEYVTGSDEPTHLYLNGKPYEAPATETPRVGTSELWEVINLTDDNHPLHIHLALFVVLEQREIIGVEELKECMTRTNDATRCRARERATGHRYPVPKHESHWKNVFKIRPGCLTRVLVRFHPIHTDRPYPFSPHSEPGYVYHCHILDHEDNAMMRPLKIMP